MTGEELFLNELNFHIRQGISKKDLTDLINERLKQLTIPVVGSSKPENKTITFEVEELSETNPHRNDALIIVDKDGNYYQTVEEKTLS